MRTTITMLLFLMWIKAFSQTTVIGNIVAEEEPLVGANIIIKNSNKGTITDFDGNFEINVNKRDTLLISYLGYNSKEVVVENQKEIKVVLDGNIALDAVEIVAYGSYRCSRTICCVGVINCYHKGFNPKTVAEKLYPNPSRTGRFKLKLLDDYKTINIQAFNISGQLVKSMEAKLFNNILNVDLSNLTSGIYILSIEANGKLLATKKAIID